MWVKKRRLPSINYFHMAFTSSQRHLQLHNTKFFFIFCTVHEESSRNVKSFTISVLIYQHTFFIISFSFTVTRYLSRSLFHSSLFSSVCIFNKYLCYRCFFFSNSMRATKGCLENEKKIYELSLTFITLNIHFWNIMRIRIWAMASIHFETNTMNQITEWGWSFQSK